MNLKKIVCTLFVGIIFTTIAGCEEDDNSDREFISLEIGKPIELTNYNKETGSYIKDTYYDMDLHFYLPPGIEELRNRPLMFTLSTDRSATITDSMAEIVHKYGMIAVSPLNGRSSQFEAFLKSMIETEYIDPNEVYVAGFSNGGRDVYSLAWTQQDKVKGAFLLDPSDIFSMEPPEDSRLSVCILCQTNRLAQFQLTADKLNEMGVRTKVIGLEGQDHFAIGSPLNVEEKFDCYDFINGTQ